MSADPSVTESVARRTDLAPAAQWKVFVTKNLKAIESAMPRIGITPESVARTALSQMYRNPMLMQCDKMSVMRAIVEAASLGLTFALGRAYLVPFNNKVKDKASGRESWRLEAQLIPGYQGLVDLVRRSANVKSVIANAVYEGDEFDYSTDLQEDRFHHKSLVEPEPAKLTHAYCIIRFLDGGYQWVVLTRKKIDSIRARSKAKDHGPWVTDYEAMAIKSAVRRCTKLCPASIELVRALDLDERADLGEPQELATDIEIMGEDELPGGAPEPEQSATERVKGRLKKGAAQQSPPADLKVEVIVDRFLKLAGNRAAADVEVSAATAGQIQNLDAVAAACAEKPEWITVLETYLETEEGGRAE